MSEELYTQDVVALLGVSRRTVQSWVKSGKLPVKKDAQGRNTFTLTDIESVKATVQYEKSALHTSEEGEKIAFIFDPSKQIVIDLERLPSSSEPLDFGCT